MTIEHATSDKSTQSDDDYDDAVAPLWQSVIDLGASLPPEVWDSFRRIWRRI